MDPMTSEEKGRFCAALAFLFSRPDESLGEFMQPVAPADEEADVALAETNGPVSDLFSGIDSDGLLGDLRREYDRLFGDLRGERISLVESTYKAWTRDETCTLSIAGEKGLLMGDSALHLLEICRTLDLEVPEEFCGTPDHLVLELELLSWLYRTGTESQVRKFVADHLDWIPDLRRRLEEAGAHFFYRGTVAKLALFLEEEKERWKEKKDGPQSVH
jgi:TorA maturation chaperone TorD